MNEFPTVNEWDISTGHVFGLLVYHEDKVSIPLITEVENKIMGILCISPVDRVELKSNDPYTESKRREYALNTENREKNIRPFSWFGLQPGREENIDYYLYEYHIPCIVDKDLDDFPYFFALTLGMIDKMKIHDFLSYQLSVNFENDAEDLEYFLKNLFATFPNLVDISGTGTWAICENFLNTAKAIEAAAKPIPQSNRKSATLAQYVLVFHYLFKLLDNEKELTNSAKAKFISNLTGFDVTQARKHFINPISLASGSLRNEDLIMVETLFTELKLWSARDLVSKDLKI